MVYPRTPTHAEEQAVEQKIRNIRKSRYFAEMKTWPRVSQTSKSKDPAFLTDVSGWRTLKTKMRHYPAMETATAHRCIHTEPSTDRERRPCPPGTCPEFCKRGTCEKGICLARNQPLKARDLDALKRKVCRHRTCPLFQCIRIEKCASGTCPDGCDPEICPLKGGCFPNRRRQNVCPVGVCPGRCDPEKCPLKGKCSGQGGQIKTTGSVCPEGACPGGCNPRTCPLQGKCGQSGQTRTRPPCPKGSCPGGCDPATCPIQGRCFPKQQAGGAGGLVGGANKMYWPWQTSLDEPAKRAVDWPCLVYRDVPNQPAAGEGGLYGSGKMYLPEEPDEWPCLVYRNE